MTTLLVTPEELKLETLTLEGDAYRHLFRAARLAVAATLRVVDGRGAARQASVAAVGRRRAELTLGGPLPSNEPSRAVEIFVAPPKSGRASWMVEKLTEIGVRRVHLWATERAPRRYGSGRLERLRRVAAAALEQCGRSYLPEVGVVDWQEGLDRLRTFQSRWLLLPGAPPPADPADTCPVALLVGPEGGWTPAEQQQLVELPCRAVGLGPTILRVETAALAAAARALIA